MRKSFLKYKFSKVYLPTKWHSFILSLEHKRLGFFLWLWVHLCVCVNNWLTYMSASILHWLISTDYLTFFIQKAVKITIRSKYPFSDNTSTCQTTGIKSYHNDHYWKMSIIRNTDFADSFPIVFSLQIKSLANQQSNISFGFRGLIPPNRKNSSFSKKNLWHLLIISG